MTATRITSTLLTDTGLMKSKVGKNSSFSFNEVKSFNELKFGDDLTTNALDDLLNLATALGVSADTSILTTYTTSNGDFFSIPSIQLNADGVLSLGMGSETSLLLVYNAKSKSYYIDNCEINFKPLAWIPETTPNVITSVYFSFSLELDFDGMSVDVQYSLPVKTKKDTDLKVVVVALQKGTQLTNEQLVQVGTGGSYTRPVKPWMLNKGFYKILQVNPMETPKGQTFTIQNGYVGLVDNNGNLSDDVRHFVSLKALPFKPLFLNQSINGWDVFIGIDGGFRTDDGKISTIGHCEQLGTNKGEFTEQEFKDFVIAARKVFMAKRRTVASKLILTEQQIQDAIVLANTPKDKATNTIADTDGTLANDGALVGKVPDFSEIPF